ncbi:MAG: nitrate reductase molybdenum cofactor assembly chaperone [Armatimonadetes bacterium]|nr:nitrate reductase molybdenum cofactor assembly chaperone [Armatimonadota bacterium]
MVSLSVDPMSERDSSAETCALLEMFADLLDYPGDCTPDRLQACLEALSPRLPEAANRLAEWRGLMADSSTDALRELYTQTFDLNPACPLDVGYYLFGEDYQRGIFLVMLREGQEEAGLAESTELPDHLPVVLRWLARIEGTEVYTDMVTECLRPVLEKMVANFKEDRHPYRGVLQALSLVLGHDIKAGGK